MPHGKRYTRSGVFAWTPPAFDEVGLIVVDYAQHFDPLNAPGQSRIEWIPVEACFGASNVISPTISVNVPFRANALAWCGQRSEARPRGISVAGCESGTVLFFDPEKLISKSEIDILSSRRDHQGHVLSVDVSCDGKWAMSGGGTGQLLLWDLNQLGQPFSPVQPSFQDQVKCVRWNRSMDNIVASLSSHRLSLWDLRRNGAPVIDLGEIGGGCDWAELCWSPMENTGLLTCSQADAVPLLYKWDLRYPTAPVREHRVHQKGVTSLDWSTTDTRFLLSASHDHQILVSNPETGEVHGNIGCERDDWIRNVAWCPGRPDLIAIQYYQHPLQISNLQSFGSTSSEDDQASAHLGIDLNVIPAWVSAAPVGARFSLGCRMATHARKWDPATNQWTYHVEIKRVETEPQVYARAMELQNAFDGNQLPNYCEDKSLSSSNEDERTLWMFLTTAASGQSRKQYLRLLGFAESEDATADTTTAQRTSGSGYSRPTNPMSPLRSATSPQQSSEVSALSDRMRNLRPIADTENAALQRPRERSAFSTSTVDGGAEEDEQIASLPPIDVSRIDQSTWTVVEDLINGDDENVIASLLANNDYTTALLLYMHDRHHFTYILNRYLQGSVSPAARLLTCLAMDKYTPLVNHIGVAKNKWQHLVGVMLARQSDRRTLTHALQKLAQRWRDDPSATWIQAAVSSVIAQDPDGLLAAMQDRPLEERVSMVRVLARTCRVRCESAEWERVLGNYCGRLVDHGCIDVAWRLLSELETKNEALLSLRHALWNSCGGRERTQVAKPYDPDVTVKEIYANALRPRDHLAAIGRRQSMPYPQQQLSSYGAPPTTPPLYGAPQSSVYGSQSQPQTYLNGGYGTGAVPPPAGLQQTAPSFGQPTMAGYGAAPAYGTAPQGVYGQPQVPSYNAGASNAFADFPPPEAQPAPIEKSAVSAWNDPPPLPSKKQASRPQSVMQVSWKPMDAAPASAMGMHVPGMPPTGGYHTGGYPGAAPMQSMPPSSQLMPQQMMAYPGSTAQGFNPQHNTVPEEPKPVLCAEDQAIMEKFHQLADAVLAASRSPGIVNKVEDLKRRLDRELALRLAQGKLGPSTRGLLWQAGDAANRGDFHGAQQQAAQMVKTGADFVEVSAFLPALKSLFSQASTTFQQQQYQ